MYNMAKKKKTGAPLLLVYPYYRFALHTVTTLSCICTRWIQRCQLNALLPHYPCMCTWLELNLCWEGL